MVSSYSFKFLVIVGFSGCVKRLRLYGRFLGVFIWMVGVIFCILGFLEVGLFFLGSGGVIILDFLGVILFDVGLELEVWFLVVIGLIFYLG